jgi:hypothetical protein
MKQSRRMSLVEALANVAVGFGVAVTTQIAIFPLFGLHASLEENLAIGAIFTVLCGAPHNPVYAELIVMRSLRRLGLAPQGFGAKITPHNSLRRQPSAWPGACRKLERDRAVASVQQFNATEATMGRNANYAERDVRLFQPNHLSNNKFFRSFGPDSA